MFVDENDKAIYREELAPRLPRKLLDAHVHIHEPGFFPPDYKFPADSCHARFGEYFTLDMWRDLVAEMLPEQEVSLNCLGVPRNEAYRDITPQPDNRRVFAMTLLSPADSAADIQRRVESNHLVGVKPYLNFAADFLKKPANDVMISDMLTPEQLEYINDAGLAVTLHIPRPDRFADPVNQRQMVELCRKYPRATFIFAHIGRAYFLKNIEAANLEELAEYPNAWFDTAMLNDVRVFENTFRRFPLERVVFGSDAPIAFLRGKSVEINNQYAYVMGEAYRIGSVIHDPECKIKFTTFFYEQLRGLLNALPEEKREAVFYGNAFNLFNSIAKRYEK